MLKQKQYLKMAISATLPIFAGYLFLGFGFGVLMSAKGFHVPLIALVSLFVFSGSLQYFGITLLVAPFNPLYALFMTIMINARHVFYGIPLLQKFNGAGKYKPYLMFGLTDETFSLLCSIDAPKGIERGKFFFYVTVLNHFYWILGGVLGGVVGTLFPFNTKGVDFVLTALFVVIFLNQWKEASSHLPAFIGIGCTALSLFLFSSSQFLLPAMGLMLLVLILCRPKIMRKEGDAHE